MEPGALLLLRADASIAAGTGHVMRCLALAQAWQDAGGRVALATTALLPSLETRLSAESVAVHVMPVFRGLPADADATAALAQDLGARWVVLDGYQFDADYERSIAVAGPHLLRIDDGGRTGSYRADIVLDQNLGADPAQYLRRGADTECLLGSDFVLLRREFRAAARAPRELHEDARRVLVTLGGTDPDNVTAIVLAGLRQLAAPDLEVTVVVGGGNPHLPQVGAALAELPGPTALRVDATDLPALMAHADVAVAAGGGTCWELCAMGVPMLLVALADNQRANVRGLAAAGVALDLGDASTLTPGRVAEPLRNLLRSNMERGAMAQRGRALVDGEGARRVVSAMTARDMLRFRRATAEDAQRLFDWANDPVTRAMSFRSGTIPWADHLRWLAAVLAAHDRLLLVVEGYAEGAWQPIGQLRFDAGGVVSVGFDPAWRGRGLAAPALRRALSLPQVKEFGPLYTAYIRPENAASQRAFRQAGFRYDGMARAYDVDCGRFVRDDSGLDGEGAP
jgi:UDP-2,4-diacetamido-2,4,6-trideoxy-beta-L-altropyranose hydrolase